MERMLWADRRGDDDAIRITTAAPDRGLETAARQRRYLYSMAVRTACVIGAVVVGPGWLRWVLVAGAVILPYVAVVAANVTDRRDRSLPLTDAAYVHGELAAGPVVRPVAPGDGDALS